MIGRASEVMATRHEADFERERERLDRLMVDLLRATLAAQTAKEGVARLDGEMRVLRSRPWWSRLAAWQLLAPETRSPQTPERRCDEYAGMSDGAGHVGKAALVFLSITATRRHRHLRKWPCILCAYQQENLRLSR